MYQNEKRRFSRVCFQRGVRFSATDSGVKELDAKNLSMGGMFLQGGTGCAVGQICRIEMHETGQRASVIYTYCGKVVRVDAEGVGVKFVGMEEESHAYLQTMILYNADDPLAAVEDFDDTVIPWGTSTPC